MCLDELKSRKDLTLDEINILLDHEKDVKVYKKLTYFKFKRLGYSKIESCQLAGIKENSRYYLEDLWEEGGYNSLIPHYNSGGKSKLNERQQKELKEILQTKDSWIVNDVVELINNKFEKEYTYQGVRSLLIKLNVTIDNYFEVERKKETNSENLINGFDNLSLKDKEELNLIINKISNEKSVFVLKKLIYLLFRTMGFSNTISSSLLDITRVTGNNWFRQWKKGGYENLKRKPGQGRKPELDDENIEDLKKN